MVSPGQQFVYSPLTNGYYLTETLFETNLALVTVGVDGYLCAYVVVSMEVVSITYLVVSFVSHTVYLR